MWPVAQCKVKVKVRASVRVTFVRYSTSKVLQLHHSHQQAGDPPLWFTKREPVRSGYCEQQDDVRVKARVSVRVVRYDNSKEPPTDSAKVYGLNDASLGVLLPAYRDSKL